MGLGPTQSPSLVGHPPARPTVAGRVGPLDYAHHPQGGLSDQRGLVPAARGFHTEQGNGSGATASGSRLTSPGTDTMFGRGRVGADYRRSLDREGVGGDIFTVVTGRSHSTCQ
jgi:hypothetical protein